jgi:DNA-binding NarL/FixJ family response regulator
VNEVSAGVAETISVLLVDDHWIMREGLRALFSAHPDIVVVGEARHGVEALQKVDALVPDVVIMDLVMPRMSGLEATAHIRDRHPGVKVLILYDDDEYVQQAIRAGAAGYALKSVSSDELVDAVHEMQDGAFFLQPAAAAKVIGDYVSRVRGDDGSPSEKPLTQREREIVTLIAEGSSNQVIADTLGLSRKTVESHRANVMRKLGARNVTGLVRHAVRTGLIHVE